MVTVQCVTCANPFETKPSTIKRGYGKYCSITCGRTGNRRGKVVACLICSKEVYRAPEKLSRAKSQNYFCSKSCQAIWKNSERIGPNHPNWKHGKSAYRSVLDRHKIVRICTLCTSKDERILAVHHVDRNRLNNVVDNLAWLCHNCHFLVHHDTVEKHRFLTKLSKRS